MRELGPSGHPRTAWCAAAVLLSLGGCGTAPNDSRPVAPPRPPYDWVGIIGTGQSLSVGAYSVAVSVTQPFANLMLLDRVREPKYPIDGSPSANWAVVPLTEPHRPNVPGSGAGNLEYPNNIAWTGDGKGGETPHSGMANTISAIWTARGNPGDYVTVHSSVGIGGVCLDRLARGSHSFDAALSEARVYANLAAAADKTYGVGAVILTHGECDTSKATPDYGDKVVALSRDYNDALRRITGQTHDVLLLASQQSAVTSDRDDPPSVQLWRAGRDHPGAVICTGPKYAYGPYDLHLPAPGYERLGEKYGEVFDLVVNQGIAWKPLGPNRVTRTSNVITIDFDVPNPPLAWDEHLPAPHQKAHTAWAAGRGFEVRDDEGREVGIASVEISGASVLVRLSEKPAPGAALTVAYALTADADGYRGGTDVGMHGQLRDSDPFPGYAVESIDVQATRGSAILTAAAGAFDRRAALDLVSGGGLPPDTVVSEIDGNSVTLSTPWNGPTGKTTLLFHHNHHNYGVHFSWKVR